MSYKVQTETGELVEVYIQEVFEDLHKVLERSLTLLLAHPLEWKKLEIWRKKNNGEEIIATMSKERVKAPGCEAVTKIVAWVYDDNGKPKGE